MAPIDNFEMETGMKRDWEQQWGSPLLTAVYVIQETPHQSEAISSLHT